MAKKTKMHEVKVDGVSDKDTAVYVPKDQPKGKFLDDPKIKVKMAKVSALCDELSKDFPGILCRVAMPLVEDDNGQYVEGKPSGFTMVVTTDPGVDKTSRESILSYWTAQICYEVRDLSRALKIAPVELAAFMLRGIIHEQYAMGQTDREEVWEILLGLVRENIPDRLAEDYLEFCKDPVEWDKKNREK